MSGLLADIESTRRLFGRPSEDKAPETRLTLQKFTVKKKFKVQFLEKCTPGYSLAFRLPI